MFALQATLKKAKRFLYLFHRWLGVALCLWFVLLFASGIIMMYVEYPELTEEERLWQLAPLQANEIKLTVADAARLVGVNAYKSAKLAAVAGRPAYQLTDSTGALHTVFADNGEQLAPLTVDTALIAARASGFASYDSSPVYDGLVNIDQWTVSSVLDSARPLHRIAINDNAGTVLYISEQSGHVVRDSNRIERFWNWLGSTVHWIYPWQLRQHTGLWTTLLTYLSLAGVLSVVSGTVVGWWRLRLRRKYYHGKTAIPYKGWQRWHHVLGLGFVLFIGSWSFSGLMSMFPWGIFDNTTSVEEQIARYYGGPLQDLAQFPLLPTTAFDGNQSVKEVEWRRLGDLRYLVFSYSATSKSILLPAGINSDDALPHHIVNSLPALQPQARSTDQHVITHYDNWYYSHHNRYRPLPVLEARFDDVEQSWYHIDLTTGAVVQRLTSKDRWARWLYNGMHSFDFAALFQHRPLWDISLILLLICGFAFSLSAVVIGWRRVKVSS